MSPTQALAVWVRLGCVPAPTDEELSTATDLLTDMAVDIRNVKLHLRHIHDVVDMVCPVYPAVLSPVVG